MRKHINGNTVSIGDEVYCWDGTIDQREVTAALQGIVSETKAGLILVDDNLLALGCAEFVEIINPKT